MIPLDTYSWNDIAPYFFNIFPQKPGVMKETEALTDIYTSFFVTKSKAYFLIFTTCDEPVQNPSQKELIYKKGQNSEYHTT